MAPKPKSDAENKEERRCEAAALEIVNKGGNVGKDLRRKDKVLITIPRRRRVFQDGIGRWNDILSEISASRCVETPSRHRRDSCPSDEVVGGFFFEFEAIRIETRCSAQVRAPRLLAEAREGRAVERRFSVDA